MTMLQRLLTDIGGGENTTPTDTRFQYLDGAWYLMGIHDPDPIWRHGIKLGPDAPMEYVLTEAVAIRVRTLMATLDYVRNRMKRLPASSSKITELCAQERLILDRIRVLLGGDAPPMYTMKVVATKIQT